MDTRNTHRQVVQEVLAASDQETVGAMAGVERQLVRAVPAKRPLTGVGVGRDQPEPQAV